VTAALFMRYLSESPEVDHEDDDDLASARRTIRLGQPLFDFVAGLAASGQTALLESLYSGNTRLHAVVGDVAGFRRDAGFAARAGAPFREGDRAAVHALRALAGLALALAGEMPAEGPLRSALAWYADARGSLTVHQWDPRAVDWGQPKLMPVIPLLADAASDEALAGAALTTAVTLHTLAVGPQSVPKARRGPLAALKTRRGRQARIKVLLVRSGEGVQGRLHASVAKGLPAGFAPDPRQMAFFSGDAEFQQSLDTAWSHAGTRRAGGTVLWSIKETEGPSPRIQGQSAGAALATTLDEIGRLSRPLAGLRVVRRLQGSNAIVGRIDEEGNLQGVEGYDGKLAALDRDSRVIVPTADEDKATAAGAGKSLEIVTANRWTDAASRARQRNGKVLLLQGIAVTLVLALIGGGLALWQDREAAAQRQLSALREAAQTAASEAAAVYQGDEPTGLLLAMASDSLAASAGEHTTTFTSLAENFSSLVKIDRPISGSYDAASMSPDGSLALLSTGGGEIDLISTQNGDRLWSKAYPPGLVIAPGQVTVAGLAIDGNDDLAAYGSSDGRVNLLAQEGKSGWRVEQSQKDPWPPDNSDFGDLNNPWALSFTPDSRQLMATDDTDIAVYNVSRAGLGNARHVCRLPAFKGGADPGSSALYALGPDQALFAGPQAAYLIQLDICRSTRLLTLPSGVTVDGVYLPAPGFAQVVGTDGDKLILYMQGSRPSTLATLPGLSNVELTSTGNDLVITASGDQGTYAYDVLGHTVFHEKVSGFAVSTFGTTVVIYDGVAEIHSAGGGSIGDTNTFYDPSIVDLAWAGGGDIVAGGRSGVEVYRDPTQPTGASEGIGQVAELSGSSGEAYDIAASPSAPLAAAVMGNSKAPSIPTKVQSWDVSRNRPLQVPALPGYRADTVAFSGSTLIVGYRGGRVSDFVLHGSRWILQSSITMPGSPMSMAAGSGGAIYALTEVTVNGRLTLRKLVVSANGQLAQAVSRGISGAGAGQVAALPGSGVVASTGAGTTTQFTANLQQVRPATRTDVGTVLGLTLIPDSNEVMVIGNHQFAVLRESTMQELGDNVWQRANDVVTAAADPSGSYFATYDFTGTKLTIWLVAPETLKQEACAAIGTNLTPAQWAQYFGSRIPYRKECPQY
jgi:hypothetical protein